MKRAWKQAECAFCRERGAEAGCGGGDQNAFGGKGFNARLERNLMGVGRFRKHCGDHLLVLFRLKRTGGIDNTAAGADSADGSAKQVALTCGLTQQIFRPKAMANFGVTAEGTGAAARNVGKGQVEGGVLSQSGGVGEAAFDCVAERGKAMAQRLDALYA